MAGTRNNAKFLGVVPNETISQTVLSLDGHARVEDTDASEAAWTMLNSYTKRAFPSTVARKLSDSSFALDAYSSEAMTHVVFERGKHPRMSTTSTETMESSVAEVSTEALTAFLDKVTA